jgi:hypothetical protein
MMMMRRRRRRMILRVAAFFFILDPRTGLSIVILRMRVRAQVILYGTGNTGTADSFFWVD